MTISLPPSILSSAASFWRLFQSSLNYNSRVAVEKRNSWNWKWSLVHTKYMLASPVVKVHSEKNDISFIESWLHQNKISVIHSTKIWQNTLQMESNLLQYYLKKRVIQTHKEIVLALFSKEWQPYHHRYHERCITVLNGGHPFCSMKLWYEMQNASLNIWQY